MSVLQAESHLNFDWGKAERLVSCQVPTADLLTFLCLKTGSISIRDSLLTAQEVCNYVI